MADPDLQIVGKWGGGGGGKGSFKKKFSQPFGPQFGPKIRGAQAPRIPPPDPPLQLYIILCCDSVVG